MRITLQALRYLRGWVAGGPPVVEREIRIDRGSDEVPATLFLPELASRHAGAAPADAPADEQADEQADVARDAGADTSTTTTADTAEIRGSPVPGRARPPALPGWVVLHGITRPGRRHPSILRFARSLAAARAAVLVPEIPEWTALELAPEAAVPTIRAAILALDARPETAPGRIGLIGFSFGAPQALIAAAHPSVRGHLAGVAAFGGYADVERAFRFQFTGRHEWEGVERHRRPDPYGRWVVGANCITRIPGLEDAGDVEEALRELATAAGERQIASWDPVHDPVKRAARQRIAPERRHVFDTFAPPAGEEPDPEKSAHFVQALAHEARRSIPLLDPLPHLAGIEVPVRLVHGRGDHLIPYTETLRLARAFPPGADVEVSITGLFSHSQGAHLASRLKAIPEAFRFLRTLRSILTLTSGS